MAGSSDTTRMVKRRGILAAAGAVVAGIAAKQAAQPVAAVTSVTLGGDGNTNVTTAQTIVRNNGDPATVGTIAALVGVRSTDIVNSYGGTIGVFGVTDLPGGVGVRGSAQGTEGIGVTADGPLGLQALGSASAGVYAQSLVAGGQGVYGYATATAGTGVYGYAPVGTGVYGITNTTYQYGVLGTSTATSSIAIGGIAIANGSSAFSGGTTNPNAYAGYFQGTVVVQGNFGVTGNKSAIIQHPRTGDHRLVYCVESPEAWFEDFGEGTLAGGKAEVKLDPDFAALIHADTYHVFLTGYDEHGEGLVVSERRAEGFVVKERKGAAGSGRFSWRVVGKRADVKAERLGKFVMPNLPLPDTSKFKVPDLPTPALPPKKP